jgi:hypothetical protein
MSTIAPQNWLHTLYLQVDNCWRKNKNTTMLCYLSMLVHFNWFKTIEIYSLTSNYTHKDINLIDQMFSIWNIYYWNTDLQ